jgi:hypothetical protein
MLIRAHPFPQAAYHGRPRSDMIMWRTPYCPIEDDVFDPSLPEHRKHVGYGRVILLFKAALSPSLHTAPTQHTLAFIEEFWPYRPIDTDILDDEYGCSLMYSTTPHACYYVIGVGQILGTAAITPNSAPDRIPYRGLRTPQSRRQNPGATADTGPYNSSGSPLYRLNIWHMMWGSMISARPIPFPTPSSLTDSQKDAVAQRHATDPGCSFRRAGTSWVPLAGHDSF